MDGNREHHHHPRDPFSDPTAKKMEQQHHQQHHQHQQNNAPPVKRPRQKGLQFDLAHIQQQPRNECPPDFSMQLHGFYPNVAIPGGDMGRWYHEVPHYPRRDTPVPEAEDVVMADEPPPPPPPPPAVQQWLRKTATIQRQQRPLQPMERFAPRKPREEPPMMMEHPVFPMETMEDRMTSSPFSAARTERDRFMHLVNGPPPPPMFDPHQRPAIAVMPQPHARKARSQAGGIFAAEGGYDEEFSSAFAAAKNWGGNCKEAETALAGQRLRQPRRSRAPGPNREPDLGSYVSRQNGLFDFGYAADAAALGSTSGRISAVRDRLRRLEQRQASDDNREQVWPTAEPTARFDRPTWDDAKESRASMERYRARQQARERRSPCRGQEFGALMNVLAFVPDDDVPGNARDASSGISRMREAVFGIVNSRLPPHLLFSDRDFDGDDYEFLSRLDDAVESKKGADEKIINKINLCAFGTDGPPRPTPNETEPRCPICLENFAQGVELRVMPCQHQYHRCCLDKWLKIKAVCPICNMNIKDKFLDDTRPTAL